MALSGRAVILRGFYNRMMPDGINLSKWDKIALLFILVAGLLPRLYFFRSGLWVWDSGEFAMAVKEGMLPHAPYIGYLALGSVLKALSLPLDMGLSLLSLAGGTLAIAPFFAIALHVFGNRREAYISTFVFASAPALINQSGYQEIYAVQCFFVLLSVALLLNGEGRSYILSAALFGFSLTINVANIFIFPFFAALLVTRGYGFTKALRWFAIVLGIEAMAFAWSIIKLGSFMAAVRYWFFDIYEMLSVTVLGPAGGAAFSLVDAMGYFIGWDWLVDKFSSLLKSMFFAMTPSVTVFAIVGFLYSFYLDRRKGGLLAVFALPYLLFDLLFPLRAIGLYVVFYLPVAVLCVGAVFEYLRRAGRFGSVAVPATAAIFSLLYLVQWFHSPVLPRMDSPNGYVYGLRGYFKWIGAVTPEKSMIMTEREPWIVKYYSDRDVVYSDFLQDWTKRMTLFPKGMPTANSHPVSTIEDVITYMKKGVKVYSTTSGPFGDYVEICPAAEGVKEVFMLSTAGIYREAVPGKSILTREISYDFSTDKYQNEAYMAENISRYSSRTERFIHPSEYDKAGFLTYRLDLPEGIESIELHIKMAISHQDNYIKVSFEDARGNVLTATTFKKTGNDVQEASILLPVRNGSKRASLKIEMFADDSGGQSVISARVQNIRIIERYNAQKVLELPIYRVDIKKIYFDEEFSGDSGNAFIEKNIAYSREGGFVHPARYDTPSNIGYVIEPRGEGETISLKASLYVLGEANYAAIYASSDGVAYNKVYGLKGSESGRKEDTSMEIPLHGEGMVYLKVVLYSDSRSGGPLIDSRLERLMVYGDGD